MEVQLYLDKKSIYCYSTSTFTTMPSTSLWKDLVAKSQKGFHFFVLELTWSVESKKCIFTYNHLVRTFLARSIFERKKKNCQKSRSANCHITFCGRENTHCSTWISNNFFHYHIHTNWALNPIHIVVFRWFLLPSEKQP